MPDDHQRGPDVVTRYVEALRRKGASPTSPDQPATALDQPSAPSLTVSVTAERLEPRVSVTAERLEPHVDVTIDPEFLKKSGFINPNATERSQLAEEFRLIKRPLLNKAFGAGRNHNDNVVLVTSPQPAEGKTFIAVNLALSVASERDLHVMLVDTDLYTQSVTRTLGLPQRKGLVDLLSDETLDFADILLRTNIPNFTIVQAGGPHPHATELLSSQRMIRLTREISSRYTDRLIIMDSPPILASSEPMALAAHVGQVALVVEQNRTGWRQIEQALPLLSGCSEISFILNKMKSLPWRDYYGSYYNAEKNHLRN